MDKPDARRRSPGWVRQMDQGPLHALALRLRRLIWRGDATSAQEWLFERVVSELEYRHRQARVWKRCTCELCQNPFPWDQGEIPY